MVILMFLLKFFYFLIFTKNRKWPGSVYTIYLNHIYIWLITKYLQLWHNTIKNKLLC